MQDKEKLIGLKNTVKNNILQVQMNKNTGITYFAGVSLIRRELMEIKLLF